MTTIHAALAVVPALLALCFMGDRLARQHAASDPWIATMTTTTTSAPPRTVSSVASALAEKIAPSDLAGQGAWDNNSRIPWQAWPLSLLGAFLFLVVLPWMAHGAGM
ncbi:hypothetical protein RAN3_1866 [plant metagenome]|uniref:Uncharacterized protein n=1 Tax=plant metagenome TaxID=1297885 RepID=A0A484VCD7_9ZZZZ